jgi:ERCC4-type nuclease
VVSRIIADAREAASGIPEELEREGVYVQRKELDVGDYIVGQCVIERKTARDFISSLYSGRLFEQAERISRAYQKFMLIVEGDIQDSLADMKNPRAYWGALLALALDFDFKILFTLDQEQTADVISLLARKTAGGKSGRPLLVRKPRMGTARDWQLMVLEALPTIGPKLADKLLRAFGSVRSIFLASRVELAVKGGIGEARAKRIQELLDTEYRRNSPKQTKLTLGLDG